MTNATDTVFEDAERPRRLSRDRMLDPINLILIPNLVLVVILRRHHVIAAAPLWEICGSLVVAHATSTVFAARFTPGTARAKPKVFLALTIGLGGAFFYIIGWGAVLAVSFVASAAVVIQTDGSRYKVAAIVAALATILAGEIAVAFGVVQSMISEPTGHGLAVIEAAVTAFVIALVARGQRDKELVEARERESEERFRALVQYASDAIVVIDDTGAVMYASPAAGHLFGCDPTEFARFDLTCVDPDHAEAISEVFRRLRTRPGGVEAADVPIRRTDGTSRWVEVRLTNLLGNPAVRGHVCNLRDIIGLFRQNALRGHFPDVGRREVNTVAEAVLELGQLDTLGIDGGDHFIELFLRCDDDPARSRDLAGLQQILADLAKLFDGRP